jgi:ribosomal protein S14
MTPPPSTTTGSSDPAAKRSICARCGREHTFYRRWPEGHLCRTCVLAAITIHGVCPGCGDDRILPGRNPAGAPICPVCAGIRRSVFHCRRCSVEGRLYHGKLCARCTLADRVAAVLDNGTGHIDPALAPLATALTTAATPTPAGRLAWLPSLTTATCCAPWPPQRYR